MSSTQEQPADPGSVSAAAAALLRGARALAAAYDDRPHGGAYRAARVAAAAETAGHALQQHAVVLADCPDGADELARARRGADRREVAEALEALRLAIVEHDGDPDAGEGAARP